MIKIDFVGIKIKWQKQNSSTSLVSSINKHPRIMCFTQFSAYHSSDKRSRVIMGIEIEILSFHPIICRFWKQKSPIKIIMVLHKNFYGPKDSV